MVLDRSGLSKVLVCKSLKTKVKSRVGRNETGRITSRHRGGRHQRQLKYIDYTGSFSKYSSYLSYVTSEYDCNRSALISRVINKQFKSIYRLGSVNQELSTNKRSLFEGNVLPLKEIRGGSSVYNIDGKYCRAGGSFGRLLRREGELSLVRLSSKETKWFDSNCTASLGESSNNLRKLLKKGKAGCNRWIGHRPVVRGNAKNAVDHPNGGKTRGGSQPKTIWGTQAKWASIKRTRTRIGRK